MITRQEEDGQHSTTDMEKYREEHVSSIRRNQRQEIVSKRRNTNIIVDSKPIGKENADTKLKTVIQQALDKMYYLKDLYELVKKAEGQDIYEQHEGMIGIRKLLSMENQHPIQAIIDSNMVPRMIKFLSNNEHPRLQIESAWALTNIAFGTTNQCQSIIDKGGIPLFVKLLGSPNDEVVQQAVWALGNISGDSTINRDLIIKSGAVAPLIKLNKSTSNLQIFKQSAWALTNLCRGSPLVDIKLVIDAAPVFVNILLDQRVNEMDIISDCAWALSYLTDGPKSAYKIVMQGGVIEKLVLFLKSPTTSLATPALRIIGNVCSTNDLEDIRTILSTNFLDNIVQLLNHDKKLVRKEVCWVLANITGASNQTFIMRVLSHTPLVNKLYQLLDSDHVEVRKEILVILKNSAIGLNPNQLVPFARMRNTMGTIARLMLVDDYKTLINVLRTLYAVLDAGKRAPINGMNMLKEEFNANGGIDLLEKAQLHQMDEVYQQTMKVIMAFYEIDDQIS